MFKRGDRKYYGLYLQKGRYVKAGQAPIGFRDFQAFKPFRGVAQGLLQRARESGSKKVHQGSAKLPVVEDINFSASLRTSSPLTVWSRSKQFRVTARVHRRVTNRRANARVTHVILNQAQITPLVGQMIAGRMP